MQKTVALVSGGIDSVAMLHKYHAAGHQVHCLFVNYGQRQINEYAMLCRQVELLGLKIKIADLRAIGPLFGQNALTDAAVELPKGPGDLASMLPVWVPNRNTIFVSLAYAWAVTLKADNVAIGINANREGLHQYPDTTPTFIWYSMQLNQEATGTKIQLLAPWATTPKTEVIQEALKLGVPLEYTWSCYNNLHRQCGLCAACQKRKAAFQLLHIQDPAPYIHNGG